MKSNLKAGDIVQLKSGSPKMTIMLIDEANYAPIKCQWFAGAKLQEDWFTEDSLIKVKKDDN